MYAPPDPKAAAIVELYKVKISAALDDMSPDDIRALVKEIEEEIEDQE